MPTIEEYRSHITIARLLIYVVIKIEMYKTAMYLVAICDSCEVNFYLGARVTHQSSNAVAQLVCWLSKIPSTVHIGDIIFDHVIFSLLVHSDRELPATTISDLQCRPNMF